MKRPDARKSRLVLIGTADYEHLLDLPAVARNLTTLQEAFTQPETWGVAPQHCRIVHNPQDSREMLQPVDDAGAEASDVLLVYVAGHGVRSEQGDLLLALPSAKENQTAHEYTTVAYEQLRSVIQRSQARYRVVILDCCYSGAAINTMSSGTAASQTLIEGSYVLASAPPNKESMAPEGAELTTFTEELVNVVREGIADGDKYLTLDAIFTQIRHELQARNCPRPWRQDRNDAGKVPLLKNRALRSPDFPPGYGEVPGFEMGQWFQNRRELHEARVHRATQAGICGRKGTGGAESIVVSGGYADDKDLGDVIIYTGHGGQDLNTKRQIADQRPTDSGNAALITNITSRYPVRVIRGAGGDPKQSPDSGFSYDGLYTVESYWTTTGSHGFRVLQFRLERMAENAPPVVPTGAPGARAGVDLSRWEPIALGVYRDRRVAAKVGQAHDFQCQICGMVIEAPDGSLITPTTHLKSLTVPHQGPDVPENVVCLCPTHRVQLDLGILTIEDDLTVVDEAHKVAVGELVVSPRHQVGAEYIRYHRGLYRRSS